MDRYSYGGFPIIIADRGFASFNVFAHAFENNIDFVIRAKDINVARLLKMNSLPNFIDTIIEIFLSRTQSKKKFLHPHLASQYRYICKNIAFDYITQTQPEYKMKLRILRFEVADGIFENIITSLPESDFCVAQIKEIYSMRWNIEISFRDLKHTIDTLNFHSKKKYIYQVNFSLAMKICVAFLRNKESPPDIQDLINRYILPIRSDRTYARQHRIQHPASFAYRFI